MCVCVCVCVCFCVCMCICWCVYVYISINQHLSHYIYIYIYICVCVCGGIRSDTPGNVCIPNTIELKVYLIDNNSLAVRLISPQNSSNVHSYLFTHEKSFCLKIVSQIVYLSNYL